ncbi:MAG: sigma 54-interacting transcriptional regulator, partial [Pacificimonas sp.]|nr:sigma 54-interacting transcriptional regulator [Pacificimonas sp.]
LQAKLLRALQNREITRVGGSDTIKFECRVISATNKDVVRMIAEGGFREDLYYRLFQFPVTLPPLRERGQDVLVLAHHFVEAYKEGHAGFEEKVLSKAASKAILHYTWPGNVRELKNAVERALLISDGEQIAAEDLMLELNTGITPWTQRAEGAGASAAAKTPAAQPVSTGDGIESGDDLPALALGGGDEIVSLDELKQRAVERAYELCEGNVDRAAVELGIGRATMYRLLKKYEINTD